MFKVNLTVIESEKYFCIDKNKINSDFFNFLKNKIKVEMSVEDSYIYISFEKMEKANLYIYELLFNACMKKNYELLKDFIEFKFKKNIRTNYNIHSNKRFIENNEIILSTPNNLYNDIPNEIVKELDKYFNSIDGLYLGNFQDRNYNFLSKIKKVKKTIDNEKIKIFNFDEFLNNFVEKALQYYNKNEINFGLEAYNDNEKLRQIISYDFKLSSDYIEEKVINLFRFYYTIKNYSNAPKELINIIEKEIDKRIEEKDNIKDIYYIFSNNPIFKIACSMNIKAYPSCFNYNSEYFTGAIVQALKYDTFISMSIEFLPNGRAVQRSRAWVYVNQYNRWSLINRRYGKWSKTFRKFTERMSILFGNITNPQVINNLVLDGYGNETEKTMSQKRFQDKYLVNFDFTPPQSNFFYSDIDNNQYVTLIKQKDILTNVIIDEDYYPICIGCGCELSYDESSTCHTSLCDDCYNQIYNDYD